MTEETLRIAALGRDNLPVDTVELARYLVGRCLVHDLAEGRISGRIVETEAYPLGDSTSHAFAGRRPYNGSLFLAPGHAYVRLTYGLSYMLNVSSEAEGIGAGVLIRAVEPLEGIALMQARRPRVKLLDLARGPRSSDTRVRHRSNGKRLRPVYRTGAMVRRAIAKRRAAGRVD